MVHGTLNPVLCGLWRGWAATVGAWLPPWQALQDTVHLPGRDHDVEDLTLAALNHDPSKLLVCQIPPLLSGAVVMVPAVMVALPTASCCPTTGC